MSTGGSRDLWRHYSWYLAEILRCVRNDEGYGLRSFIYNKTLVDTDYGSVHFHGPRFMEALVNYTAHSLTILDINVQDWYYELYLSNRCEKDTIVTALGYDLRKLKHVKTLNIPCEMLVDWEWLVEKRLNKDSLTEVQVDNGRVNEEEQLESERRCQAVADYSVNDNEISLAEILPPSLELLILSRRRFFAHVAIPLMKKLVVLLRDDFESVPHLKDIKLAFSVASDPVFLSIFFDQLIPLCAKQGVQLSREQPRI